MDRLSKLPGPVLNNIFSFLNIKDVVKTSLLSKRWEYAWISAPCLDFTYPGVSILAYDSESKAACFTKFVDRLLFHHSGSPIKRCVFRCFSRKNAFPSSNSWLCSVLACNVQELYIGGPDFELPSSLFTSKTLVVLKLDGRFTLNLPLHVDLPSLKTLFLWNVGDGDDDDLSMQRLLSCCPVLQVLEIARDDLFIWHCAQISSISVPSLKRLVIRSRFCQTVINFVDNVSEKFSVSFSGFLVTASIEGRCASKVLEQISHVKTLSVSKRAMENISAASGSTLPLFRNLTSLQLDFFDIADHLSNILISSPNLQALSFSRDLMRKRGDSCCTLWNPPESPPYCLRNLKHVEFHHFHGTTFEESVARYLLEHAPVLCKMTIHLHNIGSNKTIGLLDQTIMQIQMQTARDAILHCKTSSATCEIRFRETKVTKPRDLELPDPFPLPDPFYAYPECFKV